MTVPALPDSAAFYRLVWTIVREIPPGRVATYGQLASMIPPPPGVSPEDYARLGPRWVGEAMNAVSAQDAPDVPWQRVINAQGGISLPPETRAGQLQRARLRAEGVRFNARERCDLSACGWDGPDQAFLDAHGLLPPRSPRREDGGQLPLF